ncbi:MAG: ATP-binding protein [Metamycoplasmataceae bacterium]
MKKVDLHRKIYSDLTKWSNSSNRKPLLLLGARQVGKTYSIKKFANQYFKNKFIYINFMTNLEYKNILENKKDPKEIIEILSIYFRCNINKDWLIIFDEIQELPHMRTSFKLFNELYKEYRIIGLGSYLGNELNNNKEGFPVGQVDILHMNPLDFEEFLKSIELKNLINDNEIIKNDIHHVFLINKVKEYMVVGGMPEVVITFLKTNSNLIEANRIKQNLLFGYKSDITKYINGNVDKLKAIMVFDNIHSFLMKENKSFTLSLINKNARYRDYENALNSLMATNIIIKTNSLRNNSMILPMNQNISNFKIFYLDVGFITFLSNLNYSLLWKTKNNSSTISYTKGAIGENYVVQQLLNKINRDFLVFYTFIKNGIKYEIDLIIEDILGNIIPVEIKNTKNFKCKSLDEYIKKYNPKYAIIFSFEVFKIILAPNQITKIFYIPLYLIHKLPFEMNKIKIEDLLKWK